MEPKTRGVQAMYSVGPQLQTNGITAESFEALAEIAISELTRVGVSVGIVCGPITTKGTGDQAYNFQVFNAVIRGLQREGQVLFDQTPYEYGLRELAHAWEAAGNVGYCTPILEIFYKRVFETGLVERSWFIPGWRSSIGAAWERQKLTARGTTIRDLLPRDIRDFLEYEYSCEYVERIMSLLPSS